MHIPLSKRQSEAIAPRECFGLGQKITEIGSALAYVDFFSRRLALVSGVVLRDVVAGIQTASVATGKLKERLKGKVHGKADAFEKKLSAFGEDLRRRFIDSKTPVSTKDVVEIQQKTSLLRKEATTIWDSLRLMCPTGEAPARMPKSKKRK